MPGSNKLESDLSQESPHDLPTTMPLEASSAQEPVTLPPRSATTCEYPASIGKYRIVEHLGGGGQAEVYRAVHPHLSGRDVVIKWANHALPASVQQMLIAEGGILARLDDPGLVRVYDVDVHEGRPYVVMEYVPGRTLQQQLDDRLPSPREGAALVARLAHTLAGMHGQGVCHRDLKPANVLFDATGRPRVVDFGLALMEHPWGQQDRKEEGVSGTLQYMAPEQANNQAERIGPRSDIFCLGGILYALLTGRPPYQGSDRLSLYVQACEGKVTPARQLNSRIPRALDSICSKAMAADPKDRFASAADMEKALRGYLRRRLLAGGLAGAVLLGLAAVGVYFLIPRHSTNPVANGIASAPLSGDLFVRVWSPGAGGKKGRRVDEPGSGALPVRNGEQVRLEVKLNRPAYVYLLWLDGDGEVATLYPWNRDDNLKVPPPDQEPRQLLLSPDKEGKGWTITGNKGLETIILLARETPLPATVKLSDLIHKLPATELRHPEEVLVRGSDRGQPLDAINIFYNRGLEKEAKEIDDPLLKLVEGLRPHFEMFRLVRFAHQGD